MEHLSVLYAVQSVRFPNLEDFDCRLLSFDEVFMHTSWEGGRDF
jgi:hypothetical protein